MDPTEVLLGNIFTNLPFEGLKEEFKELVSRPGTRIERIVSNGQVTPLDAPYNPAQDEWVILLRGSASLWIEGEGQRDLYPGDYLLIPAHRLHRVTKTSGDEPTVWLAIHLA